MESCIDLFAMATALEQDDRNNNSRLCGLDLELLQQLSVSKDNILPVVHLHDSTLVSISNDFISKQKPCVIMNQPTYCNWDLSLLNLKQLEKQFSNVEFSLFKGQSFLLSEYLRYCSNRAEIDASPLYLFDTLSDVKSGCSNPKTRIIDSFNNLPSFFSHDKDLYALAAMNEMETFRLRRPPWKWILIGPKNSGTRIHKDPYGTSAWNTLLEGTKYWVLISKEIDYFFSNEELLKLFKTQNEENPVPVERWFLDVLPTLRDNEVIKNHRLLFEYLQQPGETIFVPKGWYHVVINMQMTLCVTQNFALRETSTDIIEEMSKSKNIERYGNWPDFFKCKGYY